MTHSQQATVCPNCGKEHQLTLYKAKYYMDGTPACPVEKWMECMQICSCGMLILPTPASVNIMEIPQYRDVVKPSDSTIDKLQALLLCSNSAELYPLCANYYEERNQPEQAMEYLLKAIECNERGEHQAWSYVPFNGFLNLPGLYEFYLDSQTRLVDLYRRAGQFDKALECIRKDKARSVPSEYKAVEEWYKLETKLCKRHNSQLL